MDGRGDRSVAAAARPAVTGARGEPAQVRGSRATRPLRVTQLVFDLDGGGMETMVASLLAGFAGSRVTMSVISLSGRAGRVGAAVRGLVDQFHVVRPWPAVSMALPLGVARALRRTRADVVHLHSGAWFKGAWAARLAGVPRVVYTEHGREHRDTRVSLLLDRQSARLTDAVVTVSARLLGYMARAVHVRPDRLRTIVNGVDTARFAPGPPQADLKDRLGIPAGATVIGSVGRLEAVKRYDRLVAALVRVRSARPDLDAHLVICGDGGQRAALEAQVAKAGLGAAAQLPGWIDDPLAWYRLFDAFVLSSDSEGLSVSLLEAMACGCAPVVTDVGANAAVLGPGLRVQVVPPGDVGALAEALVGTIGTEGRCAALGAVARERVSTAYGIERMLREYENVYRGGPPLPAPE
jgi:glycosyltransferase involved in cell wall biosynthesis